MTLASPSPAHLQPDAGQKFGFENLLLIGDYRRAGWSQCAQRNEVARARWRRWTAALEPADSIFHEMPDGEEAAYCAAFDLSKWDYAKHALRHDAPKPDLAPLKALPLEVAFAVLERAHALTERWLRRGGGRGAPWRVIADARARARACDHVDFYRVRSGKDVFDIEERFPRFSDAELTAAALRAAWAPIKRKKTK